MEERIMSNQFLNTLEQRRSYYGISKDVVVSEDRIQELVFESVRHTPSAFNSQSARVVVLFGKQHDRLWDIAMEALRSIVPAESFSTTEEKINSFKNGYGTVLYFEDQTVVKGLQDQFPLYAANFPIWSLQSNGMLQLVIWTALESEGLGASLQHYTEVIEAEVKKEWNIPAEWKFLGQMPFGKPIAEPGPKEYAPIDARVKIYR